MRNESPNQKIPNQTLSRNRAGSKKAVVRSFGSTQMPAGVLAVAVLLAALLVAAMAGWPWVRSELCAYSVLQQVAGQPVPWVVGALVAEPITTEDVTYTIADADGRTPEEVRGRLYLPVDRLGNTAHDGPAMVVLHGVHHLGIDEPRLEAFAAAMASCGVRVLTPELPAIKDYHVGLESVRTIGESAQWFAAKTGGPVGVMGLSFSGGLALLAASEPTYQKAFRFVVAVGAQASMVRVAEYYRTGEDLRPDGTIERLAPHPYGPLVLEYEYLEDFVPPADLGAIRALLRANLYEDKAAEAEARAKLTPAQRTEAAALVDAGPAAKGTVVAAPTAALIGASNRLHRPQLQALSPEGHLGTLTAPVYLLHGAADNIIPSAETLWLAHELPPGVLQAELISPVISHIDFESARPTVRDQWRLLQFFAAVMRAVRG